MKTIMNPFNFGTGGEITIVIRIRIAVSLMII